MDNRATCPPPSPATAASQSVHTFPHNLVPILTRAENFSRHLGQVRRPLAFLAHLTAFRQLTHRVPLTPPPTNVLVQVIFFALASRAILSHYSWTTSRPDAVFLRITKQQPLIPMFDNLRVIKVTL